jgi:hypothetical protein
VTLHDPTGPAGVFSESFRPAYFHESDWRVFRNLHAIALERFCQRVLSDINQLSSDARRTSHQRYLAVFKLIERCDRGRRT